jgi:drug/metabolite transporter (DMT)-like permease
MSDGRTGDTRGGAFVQFYRWVFGVGHERNVGGPERTLRYILGALLVLSGVGVAIASPFGGVSNAVVAVAVFVSGLYSIYEARVQYCPLNHSIGRSTYRK